MGPAVCLFFFFGKKISNKFTWSSGSWRGEKCESTRDSEIFPQVCFTVKFSSSMKFLNTFFVVLGYLWINPLFFLDMFITLIELFDCLISYKHAHMFNWFSLLILFAWIVLNRLSLQYHPDKNKSKGAQEKFAEINNGIAKFLTSCPLLFLLHFLSYLLFHTWLLSLSFPWIRKYSLESVWFLSILLRCAIIN